MLTVTLSPKPPGYLTGRSNSQCGRQTHVDSQFFSRLLGIKQNDMNTGILLIVIINI